MTAETLTETLRFPGAAGRWSRSSGGPQRLDEVFEFVDDEAHGAADLHGGNSAFGDEFVERGSADTEQP